MNGKCIAADEAARAELPETRGSIARRIGRNIGIVVTGNAAAAGFGLITLALNARALGTSGLGVLALIMTIATLVDRIAAFQTWQPLVKLGADALAVGDKRRVGQIVTVALLFDAIAATAAAIAAVLIVLLVGETLGIPTEYLGVAAIYMATLVTRIVDAPAGVMRLFDRFGLLTTLRASEAAGQCLAAAVLFGVGAPLGAYVLSFAGVAVIANAAIAASAVHIAAKAGVVPGVRGLRAAWGTEWWAFWTFSWAMSLSGTIGVVRDRAPVLLIGTLLGPGAVGIYHLAERIAGLLGMAIWPVQQALYPEAARLATSQRHQDLRWFVLRIGGVCGTIGIIALLSVLSFGESILSIIGGPDFAQGYWALVFLVGGGALAMAGIGANVGVVVVRGPKTLLKANLIAIVLSLGVLFPLTIHYGIVGAAQAQLLFYLIWTTVLAVQFWRQFE